MKDSTDLTGYDADIPDRQTFARFVAQLADDLRENPDSWQRTDLATYLDVIAFYASNDVDIVHQNMRGMPAPNPPTWRIFADILAAGRVIYPDWES